MDKTQDQLRKGFHLAYFIVPDRSAAIQILADATSKLDVHREQEKKRIYWRHKHLKRKITRVIRDDNDMLQWLIYFEAEKHEKQQEQSSLSTADEMVIRYIKHLMQITTPMSSFYVNIALQRLLHNYSTAETRSVYEWVTDHFPGNEEYRKVKAALMSRIQARFGTFLKTGHTSRGELRFEPSDSSLAFVELVQQCLAMFTPWSTAQACWVFEPSDRPRQQKSPHLSSALDKSNLDAVETRRSHTFIHPPCFGNLIKLIGLDSPDQRLSVPRFFQSTNGDHHGKSQISREPTQDLTEQERQTILQRLAKEAVQRQTIQPTFLWILVDGVRSLELDLSCQNSAQCELQEGAKLIEFWSADGDENILLATHWIDYAEIHVPVATETAVDLGKTKQLCLKIIPDTPASLLLEMHPTTPLAVWKKYLQSSTWRQFFQKYAPAFAALLLISVVTTTIAYRNETIKQRALIESVKNELSQEKVLRAATQHQLSNAEAQLTVSFRLPPDEVHIRGLQEQNISRITISSNTVLLRLKLSVNPPAQSRYRAALKVFGEAKVLLREDYLMAAAGPANSVVTFSVPASLFQADQYYVIALDMIDDAGKHKDTQTFTFYLVKR